MWRLVLGLRPFGWLGVVICWWGTVLTLVAADERNWPFFLGLLLLAVGAKMVLAFRRLSPTSE